MPKKYSDRNLRVSKEKLIGYGGFKTKQINSVCVNLSFDDFHRTDISPYSVIIIIVFRNNSRIVDFKSVRIERRNLVFPYHI